MGRLRLRPRPTLPCSTAPPVLFSTRPPPQFTPALSPPPPFTTVSTMVSTTVSTTSLQRSLQQCLQWCLQPCRHGLDEERSSSQLRKISFNPHLLSQILSSST